MKRLAILALVGVGVVVVVAAIIPRILSTDFAKQRIAEEITRLTGRAAKLEGAASLSVYPHLAMTIGNVTITDTGGSSGEAFITTESLTSRVKLAPLLFGRIEFDGFDLIKPRIRLVVDENGAANWRLESAGNASAVAGNVGNSGLLMALGRLTITDGTIVYDNTATNRREEITDIDLEASWPTQGDALNVLGTLNWRGETVEFNSRVARPADLAAGRSSPLNFAVAATPLRLSFDGTVTNLDGLYQFDGDSAMTTPSLRRAIGWMGTPLGTGPILGAASIAGTVNWFGSTVSFANAKIELDGNSAIGGLAADFGQRTTIQGTLASAKLDLSPYLEAMRAAMIAEGPWPTAPAGLPMVQALDADLRVATDQIVIGALRIGKAVTSASLKDGRVTINVSEAQFYRGTLTARLTAAMNNDVFSASASARIAAVPTRIALMDLASIPAIDGAGTASIAIASRGQSWGEVAQAISGTAEIAVVDGSLTGVDIAELTAMSMDPLAEPVGPGAGSTQFAKLAGTVSIGAGALETNDLVVTGDGFSLGVSGWGSVVSGQIEGSATIINAGDDELRREVPLVIYGTWRNPQFAIDRHRLGEPNPAAGPDAPGAAAGRNEPR